MWGETISFGMLTSRGSFVPALEIVRASTVHTNCKFDAQSSILERYRRGFLRRSLSAHR